MRVSHHERRPYSCKTIVRRVWDAWCNPERPFTVNKRLRAWRDEVDNGKTIIVSKEMKTVPAIIDRIVRNLAQLEIIQYIKVRPDFLAASNEIKGGSRDPVAVPHHPTATGVSMILDFPLQYLQFYEMNAARKGYGRKMVDAVLKGLPDDWEVCIVMDWSGGFWEKMRAEHPSVNWNLM
jgi:hypothetical protein